ncbi:MAG: threonine synthase, partial [Muribaculaceae bacterium]|nr:threonine synthase [Muribaculaceae bacterium]
RMGLPIKRLISANNANDVFFEYLNTGEYRPRHSVQTIANAMDVGDPSNFARILDLYDNSHDAISGEISGCTYTDLEIAATVKETLEKEGYQLDPHGAVAYRALTEMLAPGETGIFLETAHPAKFKETVEGITGEPVLVPERLAAFMRGERKVAPLSADFAAFKSFLLEKA